MKQIVCYAVTSSLAGFLFGFDTVVISGAEQQIQEEWDLNDTIHGFVISMAIWGTVVGSMLGYWPAERLGRVKTLFGIGILYLVSAIWSAAATNPTSFVLARFLGGLGVGISTITSPLYNSEISPPHYRGRLAGLFQFQIVFGILMAFVSNALILAVVGGGSDDDESDSDTTTAAWRWMMGVEAIPAFVYTLLCLRLPESPRWLAVKESNPDGALEVLQSIQPDTPSAELEELVQSMMQQQQQCDDDDVEESVVADHHQQAQRKEGESTTNSSSLCGYLMKLFRVTNRNHSDYLPLQRPIRLAIAIGLFNQLSGINAILYFAPRVFELTGLDDQAALLQSVGIGVTNLVFTMLGIWLIDRVGRRQLLLVGTIGYIVTLGTCGIGFATGYTSIVPYAIFGFCASHAIGHGAVIWVYLSEIFPTKYRSKGQGLGAFAHWISAALITTFFPSLLNATSPEFVFFAFAFFMVVALIWVLVCVVETKGIPLEEMEQVLAGSTSTIITSENSPSNPSSASPLESTSSRDVEIMLYKPDDKAEIESVTAHTEDAA